MGGSAGILERRHLYIDGLVYIVKEASNIERTGIIDDVRYGAYISNEEISEKIRFTSLEEAKKIWIPKTTYYRLRKTIEEEKEAKLSKKIKGGLFVS